ncbi:hypothetical protein HZA97_02020 [Candidatus Woesearchaeota archaeon]|nr:hypothetical protein [Candidatus Woesearchaeota archaeon]
MIWDKNERIPLNFVTSENRRINLLNILRSRNPDTKQRLWMAGFLKFCGCSQKEVLEIIQRYNKWEDYNLIITESKVASIFKEKPISYSKHNTHNGNTTFRSEIVKLGPSFEANQVSLSLQLPEDLDKINHEFFQGACEISYEYELDKFNRTGEPTWNLKKQPHYRSIEGENHKLFVIDLDGGKIDECFEIAKQIYRLGTWDHFKFSGCKGFHLIEKVSKETTHEELLGRAKQIAKIIKVTFLHDAEEDQVNIDPRMYEPKRLIRGYCVNLKTNLFSIPVDMEDSIFDVINRAQNPCWTIDSEGGGKKYE